MEEDVIVFAPTKGKPESKENMLILDDFVFGDETRNIKACPAGEATNSHLKRNLKMKRL